MSPSVTKMLFSLMQNCIPRHINFSQVICNAFETLELNEFDEKKNCTVQGNSKEKAK
jgi:hypothetical protein